MSDFNTNPQALSNEEQQAKRTLKIVYGLIIAGILFPIFAVIGGIYGYIKRKEITALLETSHLDYQIRSVWVSVAASLVGSILIGLMSGVGLLMIAVQIWYIVRVVNGAIKYFKKQEVLNPESWWL